jgi:hypothetical protein
METSRIHLDDWQKEILDYNGNILLCTGRQVGKTTIMSIKAAKYLVQHPKSQIVIVSLTEDQAKLIIIMVLNYLEKFHKDMIAKGLKKPTQNKITLKNGSIAVARPVGNTGDAVRGFTGDVLIIDEGSRMPELAFTSARPILLTTAGQIWICSTPYGKQGYFYESFLNKNNRFKVFHISSEEVINKRPISDSWTETQRAEALKFLAEEKKEMSELQYGQEYLALFLDDLRQFFSDELLQKCCILKRPKPPIPEGDRFMGVDLARMGGDEIVYTILQRQSPTNVHMIENIIRSRQFTGKTEEDIIQLELAWNLKKIGIDAGSGSLGVGFLDRFMQMQNMKRKVVAMNNRDISLDAEGKRKQKIFKEDMYENLLDMVEKGEILLLDDPEIFASLKSVQWEITDRGSVTKIRIFGNYTHVAEALVRAAYLAKKEKINKLWISYI